MSISYYGVPTDDPEAVGPILEGSATDLPPLDAQPIRAELRKMGFDGDEDAGRMVWEKDDYIAVYVCPHHVEVAHGTRGGERQLAVVTHTLYVLQKNGLKVWDPQQSKWFPG
jgi:hypothetical protein